MATEAEVTGEQYDSPPHYLVRFLSILLTASVSDKKKDWTELKVAPKKVLFK